MSQEERTQLIREIRKLLELYFNSKITLGVEIYDNDFLKMLNNNLQYLLSLSN